MRDTKDMTPAQLMRCGKQRLVREITRLRLENAVRSEVGTLTGPTSRLGIELAESAKPVTHAELEAVMGVIRDEVSGALMARLVEMDEACAMAERRIIAIENSRNAAKPRWWHRLTGA